ncbi:MAG TPA: hypothetical protein DEF03_00240, partial [Bacteroidetes bacterium]|nr:hypothetical protein [Bacteroidota bacterium]
MNRLSHYFSNLAFSALIVAPMLLQANLQAQITPGSAPSEVKQSLMSQLEQRDQEIKQLLGDDGDDGEAIQGEQREALGRLVFDLLDA